MKKIFTFLVAFLTTVSGAVWGQEPDYTPLTNGSHLDITDNDTHHYTTNGTETSFYFVIDGDYSPTIYLKDVNITTGGAAFEILDGAEVTIILEGVNTITSNGDDAAVKVTVTSELTIHSSSTGILTINVPNSNDYAIGDNSALGCGTINIDGGTIKTNGTIGNGLWHGVRLNNSAILISQNVTGTGSNNDLAHGGVYFGEGNTTGKIVDEAKSFTLKSPIPEGYTINMDNKPFTVGEGGSIDVDKVINASVINAYKVSYKESTDAEINNYTHSALPSTKYVGAKYIPATWNANESTTQTDTKYQVLEGYWLDASNQLVKAGEKTDAGEPSGVVEVQYTAVWTLAEKNLIYSEDEGLSTDGSFRLWVPAAAPLTASENTSSEPDNTTLESVGLKHSDGTISKADELNITETGEKTVFMNLNSGSTNIGMSTINITIQEKEKEDISTSSDVKFAFLSESTFEYEGNAIDDSRVVSCTYGSTPITLSAHFTVSYSTDNGKTWTATLRDVVENGYKVKVTAKDESSVFKGEKVLDGTVSITPKTVTVKSVADEVYTINSDDTFDWSDNVTLEGLFEDDDVTITYNGTPKGTEYITTPGTYKVDYSISKKEGNDVGNYTIPESTTGKLVVSVQGSDKDPIDDDGDDPLITGAGDWAEETTYDGVEHPLEKIMVTYGEEEKEITIPSESIEYSYLPIDAEEGATPTSTDEVKNAGTYTATFTFPENEYGYKGIGKVSLTIGKADLTVEATGEKVQVAVGKELPKSIEISNNDEKPYIKFNTQNNEVAVYTAELQLGESVSSDGYEDGATITGAYSVNDVALAKGEGFDPNNYNLTLSQISVDAVVGKITINPDTDGEGGDEDGDDVTGGDTGEDEQPNTDDDFILISPEGKDKCSVYDGEPHGLDWLKVGDEVLLKDVDYSVLYDGVENEPVNAGEYTATIKLAEDGDYKLESGKTSFDLTIYIAERPVTVDFGKYPTSIDASAEEEGLDASLYAIWQRADEAGVPVNEGLVKGQTPKCEGTLALVESEDYPGYFEIYLENDFTVSNNGEFLTSNYDISVLDKEGNLIKLGPGEGGEDGEETLPGDDEPLIDGPDEDNPEGGIEIEDDNIGGGGIFYDYNDLILYESDGATLSSRHNKMRVRDGGSFTVSLKIDEAYAGAEPIVYVKRGRGGDWTPWKLDEVSGYYQIRNVQTDIYVKVMGDGIWVVGNEDITATDARAYAQPNKIVVITPEPTNVQIISMAGAVVATDKVTGQREFANLTEGVYIVRMGETVVKLQVRK